MNAREANRRRLLIGIALLILAVYAFLSVRQAQSANNRLAQARRDLTEVKQKLREIDRLRAAPKVAALRLESPAQIANRVSQEKQLFQLSWFILCHWTARSSVQVVRA